MLRRSRAVRFPAWCALILGLVWCGTGRAQDDAPAPERAEGADSLGPRVTITLRDGRVVHGRLLGFAELRYRLATDSGAPLEFAAAEVARLELHPDGSPQPAPAELSLEELRRLAERPPARLAQLGQEEPRLLAELLARLRAAPQAGSGTELAALLTVLRNVPGPGVTRALLGLLDRPEVDAERLVLDLTRQTGLDLGSRREAGTLARWRYLRDSPWRQPAPATRTTGAASDPEVVAQALAMGGVDEAAARRRLLALDDAHLLRTLRALIGEEPPLLSGRVGGRLARLIAALDVAPEDRIDAELALLRRPAYAEDEAVGRYAVGALESLTGERLGDLDDPETPGRWLRWADARGHDSPHDRQE